MVTVILCIPGLDGFQSTMYVETVSASTKNLVLAISSELPLKSNTSTFKGTSPDFLPSFLMWIWTTTGSSTSIVALDTSMPLLSKENSGSYFTNFHTCAG